MQTILHDNIQLYLQRRKKRKRIAVMVAVFAVLTVVAVYSAMMLPAMGKVGADFKITAQSNKAAFGTQMTLRVDAAADADSKEENVFFLLSAESTGGGLSNEYQFDADGTYVVQAENGTRVTLHREWSREGSANARGYWFTLKPGESVSFALNCVSDTALYQDSEWLLPQDEELQQVASTVESVSSDDTVEETQTPETLPQEQNGVTRPQLQQLQTVDSGQPQKLEFTAVAAQDLNKAWDFIDKKEKNSDDLQILALTWMDASALPQETGGETTLSAKTENGLVITMAGPAESFPAEPYLLSLEAEDIPIADSSQKDKAADVQESLDSALIEAGVEPVEQWMFDLRLMQEGSEVEPLGPVTITVEGFVGKETALMPILYAVDKADGNTTELQSERQSDALVAQTDSISTYAVVLASSPFGSIPSGNYKWQLASDANPLGDAAKFNLFSLGNVSNIPDVEGNAAIGGNVVFDINGFAMSSDSNASTSGLPVVRQPAALLFNGTSVTLGSWQTFDPYGGKLSNLVWVNPNLSLTERKKIGSYRYDDNTADEIAEFADMDAYFSAMGASLKNQNARMEKIAANASVTPQWGWLYFAGTDPQLNVFSVSAADLLANSNGWDFKVPETSSVLINVTGANEIDFMARTPENVTVNGVSGDKKSSQYISLAGRTLWNFASNITKITLKQGGNMLMGSVMAPNANLVTSGTHSGFNGTVVVASLTGSTQSAYSSFECHYYPSTFTIPNQEICDKTVVVNKVWENCTPPTDATVCIVLKKDGVVVESVTLNGKDDSWSHTWENLARGSYTIEQTEGPDGYSSAVFTVSDTEEKQTFKVTAARELTGDMTVNVSKAWAGGTPGASSVTFHLLMNGQYMTPDRTLTLSQANGWNGTFSNLPETDEQGNAISYSVYEEPVAGWTPSVDVITTPRQNASFSNVPTNTSALETGKIYRFVYGSGSSARALAWSTSGDALASAALSDTSQAQQWIVVASGSSRYLQNVQDPARHIYLTSSTVSASTSNRTAIVQAWSNGTVRLGNGTSSNSYYIAMNTSSVSKTNRSGAVYFTAQTYTQEVLPKIDFTVTNNSATTPEFDLSFPHYKQIDAFRDGAANPDTTLTGSDFYRLYLDARTKGHPIDLVLVVDRSGSMQYQTTTDSTGSGLRRDQAVGNMLNGVNGQDGFIKRFLALNELNNLSIVWFSGDYYGNGAFTGTGANSANFSTRMDSGVVKTWTRDQDYKVTVNGTVTSANNNTANNISYRNANGTNYMAGMWEAADMLRSDNVVANNGHKKMVVFLTDGAPTYYVQRSSSNTTTVTYQEYLTWKSNGKPSSSLYRTGAGSSTNAAERNATTAAFTDFISQNPGVIFSSVMFAPTTADTTVLQAMTANGGSMRHTQGDDNLSTVFAELIAMLTFSKNFAITDNLSQYVEWYAAQPDLKIVRTNLLTGAQDVLWQSSGEARAGTIGSPTARNAVTQDGVAMQVIDSVTYTPFSSGDSSGMVRVLFNQDYKVDIQNKYTLSFNVKTSQYAYDMFAQNRQNGDSTGYLGVKGDAGSDYAANATSSNKPGFHANASAILTYRYDGEFYEEPYDHPVIQVSSIGFVLRKTDMTGNILLPNAKFDLYKDAAQGDSGAVAIPGTTGHYGVKINTAALVIGVDGTLRVQNLTAGTYYLVETAAPSGYVLLAEPVSFTLDFGTLSVLGASQMAVLSGAESDGTPILTVRNSDGYTLPATGGGGLALYFGAAVMLMALSAALLILKKRR